MSVALLVALALGAHDNRVPGGANYCLPWTTEGAAPAGVASALSCLAQCEATTWCVAITWYANPPALYPDGCYLFRSCGRLARSQYGGRVWYRYGNPSAPPSPLPPPPSPPPPPSLPPPLPPPPWELFSYTEKVTIICSLIFISGFGAFFCAFSVVIARSSVQLVRRRPRRPVKPAIGGSPTRQMEHILHMKLPRPLKPMPIAPDHGVQLVRRRPRRRGLPSDHGVQLEIHGLLEIHVCRPMITSRRVSSSRCSRPSNCSRAKYGGRPTRRHQASRRRTMIEGCARSVFAITRRAMR